MRLKSIAAEIAAACIWASLHGLVGAGAPIPKSPMSIVLEYLVDEDDDTSGMVSLRIERDGFYHLKLVSLVCGDLRIVVPSSELTDLFYPDFSSVKLFRHFDEKHNHFVWNVAVSIHEKPRAWGEDAGCDIRFAFAKDQYSHLLVREPVGKNQWRTMKKLPGEQPVLIGSESRTPGVVADPEEDGNGSHTNQEGQAGEDSKSNTHPAPLANPPSSDAAESAEARRE